jgi:hypothetical protein
MTSPPPVLHTSDLSQNLPERPGWSVTFGTTCKEAISVCLEDQNHTSPIDFSISGIQTSPITIHWEPPDPITRRFNADREVATEYAAYGIAALVMPQLTGLTIIERSIKGKGLGFDFWLGDSTNPQPLFQRKARLEVSGIRQGTNRQIQSRVNMKLEQIKPSDGTYPGYICVAEFSKPHARIVKK